MKLYGQEEYLSKKLTQEQCLTLAARYESEGDLKEASRYLNTAAMMQWESKDYESAIRYFNGSIAVNKRIDNASGIAKLHSNLGMIYSDIREYEKSLEYFQKSLDYRLKYGEKSEIISTYINKSVVLNSMLRHTEAAQNLEEALVLATEMNDASQMKSCYGMLAETYEKAGDQEKTIHYFNLYRTFHEMVQRNRVNEARKETEAARAHALEMELEKKDKELALLAKSHELRKAEANLENMSSELRLLMENKSKQEIASSLIEQQLELDKIRIEQVELQNQRQKIWISVAVAGAVLLALLITILYRNYRYKKITNRQLAEQNEEIRALNEDLELKVQLRTSELQKTMTRLEKRNRDLDQFSHVISHNLRGPVANILGLGRVLNLTTPSDPLNTEIFERLLVATRGVDTVVKDLSTILQVEDNQDIPREKLEILPVLEKVKALLLTDTSLEQPIIVTRLNVATVITVKPYFESILYNLVGNAIKYRLPNVVAHIEIHTFTEHGNFVLQVSDNGIGIPSDDLERVFEPYKRLTLEGDGKGLGLYLTRTQVESLGGTIKVISEVGKGSEFTIHLPQNDY